MNKENKFHYDLKNVHYVPGVIAEDGTISYEKPVRIYGAVSMDISQEGDVSKIRADGIDYLVVTSNNGYSGTINFVNIPDQFRADCLGEKIDSINGIQYEDANVEPTPFALMFEFNGDSYNKRHVLYNNIATRIGLNAENKDNQKEPDMEELEITASPALFFIDGEYKSIVKASTFKDTKTDVYRDWFNRVYIPDTNCKADVTLKTLAINSLALTPSFDKDTHDYSANATSSTNTVTAEANGSTASIEIKVNDTVVSSGDSVTWNEGINEVIVKVKNEGLLGTYTVTVTKGASA